MKKNKKVAMIVYNTVSRDARVLKEAESLVLGGFDVRIFGIHDNSENLSLETLPNGVEIERAYWRHHSFIWRLVLILLGVIVLMPTISIFAFYLMRYLAEFFANSYSGASIYLIILNLAYVGLVAAIGVKVFKVSRRYKRLYSAYKRRAVEQSAYIGRSRVGELLDGLKYLVRRSVANLSMQIAVVPLIKAYKPDVVHSHDLMTVPAGISVKRKLNISLVYDSHEIYEEQASFGKPQKIIFSLLQKWVSNKVDYFITINESIAAFLGNKYPSLPDATIIMNATKAVNERHEYDGRLHQAAELSNEKILLYQGGFGPKRGLEILVKSAVDLPEGWVLVMMGWGSLEATLKRIASEVDPDAEIIRFIPGVPHDELALWTAGASLGVIPYENVNLNHWFCTPNKLWEYPNANVPILASDFPEMAKIVKGCDVGFLLPKELTERSISEAVEKISGADLESAKENCKSFVEQNNWSIYEKRLINLYEEITTA